MGVNILAIFIFNVVIVFCNQYLPGGCLAQMRTGNCK